MASIRRQGDVFEIRECIQTAAGPRQRALARFRKVLTPADLDRAAAAARHPLDRAKLVARARAQGIPVTSVSQHGEARHLLAYLRDGGAVEPTMARLLIQALAHSQVLAGRSDDALPEHLESALEWVGRPESVRGRALRGLLRTASRVAQSRRGLREQTVEPFPRLHSGRGFA